MKTNSDKHEMLVITAGSTYLDVDAYACAVALAELLNLKGKNAIAYSEASCNYSICESLIKNGQINRELPQEYLSEKTRYIIVDVSDPEFLKNSVPLDKVVEIYDHHVGFEEYWTSRIGCGAHIEFIGAAATLIYREWKKAGLVSEMSQNTALLLIAAILDNTLNLTSANTTDEDAEAFKKLCQKANVSAEWCAEYFKAVQKNVEADLKNALFKDLKTVRDNEFLPSKVAQLCVWDAESVLERLPEIRTYFSELSEKFMINIIDIKHYCSYFVCNCERCQKKIEKLFDVCFESDVAKTKIAYLRKEIIKKTIL